MACQPQDEPLSIKEQQSVRSSAQKPKLGHSDIAEWLKWPSKAENIRLYPYLKVTIIDAVPGGSFPRDTQKFAPFPGDLHPSQVM